MICAGRDLIPERGAISGFGGEHDLALRKALFKGAEFNAYRARVVCVPSFKPAWAATLVCEDEEGDQTAYSLPCADFEGQSGVGVDRAEVRRIKAPLDRKAGEAVQRVWLSMLRGVRHPRHPVAGADGVSYHFSRFVRLPSDDPLAPAGWETGQVWTPDPGSPPGRLAALADRLRTYAIAQPEERPTIRDGILKEATALQSALDRRRTRATRTPE